MTAQVDTHPKGGNSTQIEVPFMGSAVAKRCAQKLRSFIFIYHHKKACKRLKRDVEKRRNSFECEQFRRRRAAMLKHTRSIGSP